MSEKNVELVRRAYVESFAQRTVDGPIRMLMADDFEFHARPEFPSGSVYALDEMTELWADLDATYSDYELVPQDFTALGDYVVVTIKQSARLRGSELRAEETVFHLWRVSDGRLQEARGYGDWDAALKAAGLS